MAEFTTLLRKYIDELGVGVQDSLKQLLNDEAIEQERRVLEQMRDLMRYEGFDPIVIARIMAASHAKQRLLVQGDRENLWEKKIKIGIPGAEEEIIVTNDMEFSSDIRHLCLLFVSRGAAYKKILQKSSEAAKGFLTMLQEKYTISQDKRKPGTAIDSTTVTIARVAAAFPTVTMDLYHAGLGRLLVSAVDVTGQPGLEWPKAFLTPMVASMIPHGVEVRAQLLALAVVTDDLLHQGGTRTKLSSLVQYMMASLSSTMIPLSVKRMRCVKWGILEQDGSVTSSILNAKSACIQQIERKRSDDADLAKILSELAV